MDTDAHRSTSQQQFPFSEFEAEARAREASFFRALALVNASDGATLTGHLFFRRTDAGTRSVTLSDGQMLEMMEGDPLGPRRRETAARKLVGWMRDRGALATTESLALIDGEVTRVLVYRIDWDWVRSVLRGESQVANADRKIANARLEIENARSEIANADRKIANAESGMPLPSRAGAGAPARVVRSCSCYDDDVTEPREEAERTALGAVRVVSSDQAAISAARDAAEKLLATLAPRRFAKPEDRELAMSIALIVPPMLGADALEWLAVDAVRARDKNGHPIANRIKYLRGIVERQIGGRFGKEQPDEIRALWDRVKAAVMPTVRQELARAPLRLPAPAPEKPAPTGLRTSDEIAGGREAVAAAVAALRSGTSGCPP